MAGELICAIRKRFASGYTVAADLRLPLDEAPVTVLFGPSGAGKTTLLRIVAGLDAADSGNVSFRGVEWRDLPPQKRRAGFLFQDYALFPHLTAEANVRFGARDASRAQRLMQTFELEKLRAQFPRQLSSGQQQRVALARALAAEPALLLLDEPLSALDAASRVRTRRQLRRTLIESGVPAIVVTHDRAEAIALGDWIIVMVDGTIRQAGPVRDVFRKPADAAVAESLGVENVLPAQIVGRRSGLLTLSVGDAQIECVDGGESGAALACIRAEDVALTRELHPESSARNRLSAIVRAVSLEGPIARVELDCGFPLVALVTAQSASELNLREGERLCAVIKATTVHLASQG